MSRSFWPWHAPPGHLGMDLQMELLIPWVWAGGPDSAFLELPGAAATPGPGTVLPRVPALV